MTNICLCRIIVYIKIDWDLIFGLGCRRVEGDEENLDDEFEDEFQLKNLSHEIPDHQHSVINSHTLINLISYIKHLLFW